MPPFGSLYRLPTMVDETLTADEEIVFEGQNHEEAIRMSYRDYESVEHPPRRALRQPRVRANRPSRWANAKRQAAAIPGAEVRSAADVTLLPWIAAACRFAFARCSVRFTLSSTPSASTITRTRRPPPG